MALCDSVAGKTAVTHSLPRRECAASWASLYSNLPGQLTRVGLWLAHDSCRRCNQRGLVMNPDLLKEWGSLGINGLPYPIPIHPNLGASNARVIYHSDRL
jgi:hypothetical protein